MFIGKTHLLNSGLCFFGGGVSLALKLAYRDRSDLCRGGELIATITAQCKGRADICRVCFFWK